MKKLYKKLVDLKLRWKLFITIVLSTVIPFGFFISYTYNNVRDLLVDQSYSNMEMNLAQTNRNIQNKLLVYSNASSAIYMNKSIQNYLTIDYYYNGHEDLYYYLRNYFSEMAVLNSEVTSFSIYTSNLSVPQDKYYIWRVDNSVKNEEWFQNAIAKKGKVVFEGTYINKDKQLVFSLVRLLNYYYSSVYQNVLKMEIKEDYLYSLIAESNQEGEYMVLDNNDCIVACQDKTMIGLSFFDVLDSYEGHLEDNKRETAVFLGEEMLISALDIKNGWKTVSMVSTNNIVQEARSKATVVFIFGMISVLASTAVASVIISLITKRIERLTKGVEKMDEGYFGIKLPDMGNDEIGKLSDKFSQMSFKIEHLINEIYEKELIKKSSELNMLQEQVNPHFLYNALSSIASLSLRSGDKKTNEMVRYLADFYRISLNKGKQILTIRDEINLLKSYLNIQYVRFGDSIHTTFLLDEQLFDFTTIKLVLQPIVENAIHHGRIDEQQVLQIDVKLYEKDNDIIFEIIDNGKGIEEDVVMELNEEIKTAVRGYGLKNVSIRIQLQYGKEYGIRVMSRIDEGTCVLVRLPKVKS